MPIAASIRDPRNSKSDNCASATPDAPGPSLCIYPGSKGPRKTSRSHGRIGRAGPSAVRPPSRGAPKAGVFEIEPRAYSHEERKHVLAVASPS